MSHYKRLVFLIMLLGLPLVNSGNFALAQINPTVAENRAIGLIDDFGWYHVFAEVMNPQAGTNTSVVITATFRDIGDNTIASTSAHTMLDIMTPGQNSSVDLILTDTSLAQQVNSFTFGITTSPFANSPYRAFNITHSNSTDASERFHITGDVGNSGELNVTYVEVIATFYSNLTIVDQVVYANSSYTSPRNLDENNIGTFEIIAENQTAITHYSLEVQCNEETTSNDSNFYLDVVPLTDSITQGNSIIYDIRLSVNSNYPDQTQITFSTSGLPQDSTSSFNQSIITVTAENRNFNISLNVTTSQIIGIGTGKFLPKITASGIVAHTKSVILNVLEKTGFSLTIDPSSRTISQGNEGTFTITVKSGGGFSDPVTLSVSNIPPDSNANFDPVIVTPTSQGNQSTLTISTTQNTSTGTFNFIVNGTADSQNETTSASITVTAPTEGYFELDIDPDERTVFRGSSTTFRITVQSFNGFSSAVSLEVTGLPTDLTGSFMPSPVTPPANDEQESTLTINAESNADIDSYVITITGESGTITRSDTVTISVSAFSAPDFALYVQPTSLSIIRNNSGTATIQVVSVNGFEDSVELSTEGLPTGVSSSIQHPVVAPLPSGNVITKLTIQTSSSANVGNYTFTVKGESDTNTHTETIELIILNRTSFIPPFGQCIIATTTYGSELSPEVQFLRGFRDNRVLSTIAGTEFMKAFNAWYYSFSPQVASWIYQNPAVKGPMKIILAPLLGTLHFSEITYSTFEFAPELAVTTAGIVASLFIGLIYIGPIITIAHKRIQYRDLWKILKWVAIISAGSLIFLIISLIFYLFPLIMLTSSTLVLSMIMLGALLPTLALIEFLKRKHQLSK
ncbi:CFI-box-CTERM domain-containing protein [[Eubacterium] cellulosolvens]